VALNGAMNAMVDSGKPEGSHRLMALTAGRRKYPTTMSGWPVPLCQVGLWLVGMRMVPAKLTSDGRQRLAKTNFFEEGGQGKTSLQHSIKYRL